MSVVKLSRVLDLSPAHQYVLLRMRTETLFSATTSFSVVGKCKLCPHCKVHEQTTEHFLFECSVFAELRADRFGESTIDNSERVAIWDARAPDLLAFCQESGVLPTELSDLLTERCPWEEVNQTKGLELIQKYREWRRLDLPDEIHWLVEFPLEDEELDFSCVVVEEAEEE